MKQVAEWSGEPMLSVLMPTSPMPATGVTIMVPRSAARDMNLTIDQAVQYIMSCGVVVPMVQQYRQVAAAGPDLPALVEEE